jgi:hypothetical protein
MSDLTNTKILKINDHALLKDLKTSFKRKSEAELKIKDSNLLKFKGKPLFINSQRKNSPGLKKPQQDIKPSCHDELIRDLSKLSNSTNIKSPQIPFEYLPDIYLNLQREEHIFKTDKALLSGQKDITDRMRATVVDWMIDIHNKFKLRNETLFLAVNIMDNYLLLKTVKKSRLQLIGVVSLFIACKYEEIFCPEIRDFVFIMDNTFDNKDVTQMEIDVLKVLKFDITIPSSLKFFEILSLKFNLSNKEFQFGKYLLELFLLDSKYRNYLPSHISISVIYIIIRVSYPDKACGVMKLVKNEESLISCCLDICFLLENIKASAFNALNKKYSGIENILSNNIRLC